MDEITSLRKVRLVGCQIAESNYFWTFTAGAPYFGKANAHDDQGKPNGVTADHVHPIRILAADYPNLTKRSEKWLRPSLLDMHLVAGAKDPVYEDRDNDKDDKLVFNFSSSIVKSGSAFVQTFIEPEERSLGSEKDSPAPFVHIVAEPLIGNTLDDWFPDVTEPKGIPLPPVRLVAGRVGLRVTLITKEGKQVEELKWLIGLGIKLVQMDDKTQTALIWLIPDGIEFDAELPFPGVEKSEKLYGRVLLAHRVNSYGKSLDLNLLYPLNEDKGKWNQAWSLIIPSGDTEDTLLGIKFAGRKDGHLPSFRWPVKLKKNGTPDGLVNNEKNIRSVDIESKDLRIELISPSELGDVDGVARLMSPETKDENGRTISEWVKATQKVDIIEFSFGSAVQAETKIIIKSEIDQVTISSEGKFTFCPNLEQLATNLRSIYQLETPPSISDLIPGNSAGPTYSRPIIPAFVPLQDGWLQLPIPNLPPRDTSRDSNLLQKTNNTNKRSVLGNGYFRLKHLASGAEVLSAFPNPESVPKQNHSAPWSFTIQRATQLSGVITLKMDNTVWKLQSAEVVLGDLTLSTRGMLWLSSDRPDAQEALPRLGAGPGSFIDVPFETGDDGILKVNLDRLEAGARRLPNKPKSGALVESIDLKQIQINIEFDTKNQQWLQIMASLEARMSVWNSRSVVGDVEAEEVIRLEQNLQTAIDAFNRLLLGSPTNAELPKAKQAVEQANNQLELKKSEIDKTLKDLDPKIIKPWLPVLWRRHPQMPLVATMPMTRFASSGVRPLESRDLFPFVVSSNSLVMVSLKLSSAQPFLEVTNAKLKPLVGWPWQTGQDRKGLPDRGVFFASVGLPGVELRPVALENDNITYEAAVRYDLPMLDEAFATAFLPPQPGQAIQSNNASKDLSLPVATAIDWELMGQFWKDQERKLQNARIVDSYMCNFLPVDNTTTSKIVTLIEGLAWNVSVNISTKESSELPYGNLQIDGNKTTANFALKGLSGDYWVDLKEHEIRKNDTHSLAKLSLLGFSPATIKKSDFYLDNRLSGATKCHEDNQILIRKVCLKGDVENIQYQLSTLIKPIELTIINEQNEGCKLGFWFKDVLFQGDNARLFEKNEIDFDVWDDSEKLARSGFEWRFAPLETKSALTAYKLGRNQIPLFGFLLEPLRLVELKLNDGMISSVKIRCRLLLGGANREVNNNIIEIEIDKLGETYQIKLPSNPSNPLVFWLTASRTTNGNQNNSRVKVTTNVSIENDKFCVKGEGLSVEIAGLMVPLGEPTIKSDTNGLVIFEAPTDRENQYDKSFLSVNSAILKAGWNNDHENFQENSPTLELSYQLKIKTNTGNKAFLSMKIDENKVTNVSFFEKITFEKLKIYLEKDNEAIAITINDDSKETEFKISIGIIARLYLPKEKNGYLILGEGYAECELIQAQKSFSLYGINIENTRVHFSLSSVKPDREWDGGVKVWGLLSASNNINWPDLKYDDKDKNIPLPNNKTKLNTGRVRIYPDAEVIIEHGVTWLLADHRLSLACAEAIVSGSVDTTWITQIWARHTLKRGNKTLTFSGIESIAFGSAAALIPKLPEDLKKDDWVTFAARYQGKITKGEYEKDEHNNKEIIDEGMHRPGLGAVSTVLQGTLGADFRKAFWEKYKVNAPNLMVVGGFLGLIKFADEEAVPLLRLPVIAGLNDFKIEQKIPESGIELSWTDGPAARLVAITRPNATSPASATYDAVCSSIRSGSFAMSKLANEQIPDDIVSALLVEQSFVNKDDKSAADLATTPFFLSAAVTVKRLIDQDTKSDKKTKRIESLSLVAVSSSLGNIQPNNSFAASIVLRDAEPVLPARQSKSRVAILGNRLTVKDWIAPNSGNAEQLAPLLTALAVATDPDPRVALIVEFDQENNHTYSPHLFSALGLPEVVDQDENADTEFADHGRGAMFISNLNGDTTRWLAPALEGAIYPIRDDYKHAEKAEKPHSNIAGLARNIALPAFAGIKQDDLVWITQTQIPVYLPLKTTSLQGPPISWLTPASNRMRLPIRQDIFNELERQKTEDNEEPNVQPFLPDSLESASVGDRAGILTTRRTRLLGALGEISEFDQGYSRFGQPAQSGSSFAIQMRTPRPGPLPENTADPMRDRRIQAFTFLPNLPFNAIIGSADQVEGFKTDSSTSWGITVIAAPDWDSTVSDRWDGTVKLVCRLFANTKTEPDIAPLKFLKNTLLSENTTKKSEDVCLLNSALLKIGNKVIPFQKIVFEDPGEWDKSSNTGQNETQISYFWKEISVILSLHKGSESLGRVNVDIASAMSTTGSLPQIEVQWTVFPSSTGVNSDFNVWLLTTHSSNNQLIPGDARAPLTLRMSLYPSTAERGVLPLAPVTVSFTDPAYNRDLSGPAHLASTALKLKDKDKKFPENRGALQLVFAADRSQIDYRGTITFMLDVRFEKAMNEIEQFTAENNGAVSGGDLIRMKENETAIADLKIEIQPKSDVSRVIYYSGNRRDLTILPAKVYELKLAMLTEINGNPVSMMPGDLLILRVTLKNHVPITLYPNLNQEIGTENLKNDISIGLNFMLTDEPVIAPPPALYAALLRTEQNQIAVPLHAQSPMPWRIDLVDPARDFRRGMMRRQATFIWTLIRPRADFVDNALYIIKSDRNGQVYLPENKREFLTAY